MGDFDKTKLKKSETDVKNPLPSSEAIAQELEHIKFKVKPNKIDAVFTLFLCFHRYTQYSRSSLESWVQNLKHFLKSSLHFQDGIEKYDKANLAHTETMEKNTLPTKEVIEMEKSA